MARTRDWSSVLVVGSMSELWTKAMAVVRSLVYMGEGDIFESV